jgi:hypothetical protein
MRQTKASTSNLLYCEECGAGVIFCVKCDKYFKEDDDILCDEMPKAKHYCLKCGQSNISQSTSNYTRDEKTGKRIKVTA